MSKVNEAVDKFVGFGNPYFIIVDGRNTCIGKNTKYEDIDNAAEHLRMWLDTIDSPESRTIYKVYCFEELPSGKLGGKVKDIVTSGDHDSIVSFCSFQAKERQEITTDQQEARYNWKLQQLEKERMLTERLERIEALLLKKELEESEEGEEEIEEQMQPANMMGALMNNPTLQTAIANGVVSLLGNFLQPNGQPKAVAGIPQDNEDIRIGEAVERLKQYDPELPFHLEKLADMAESNTPQFLGLLKFL
jgi:hypothetical protein